MKIKRRMSKISVATIIPLTAIVVAIAAIIVVIIVLDPFKKKDTVEAVGDNNIPVISALETTEETFDNGEDYTLETNYKGGLSQYPELYKYPFKKTESYICNKDYSEKHSESFKEYEQIATSFYENLLNIDYRTIIDSDDEYVGKVMANGDYEAYITTDIFTEDAKTRYLYEYIYEIADYIASNEIEISAEFFTDDSLVYSDYYVFVRGELVFTIYNSTAEDLEYEVGKEYQIPMEVALRRNLSNPDVYSICSFGRADDITFYMNP